MYDLLHLFILLKTKMPLYNNIPLSFKITGSGLTFINVTFMFYAQYIFNFCEVLTLLIV